MINKQLLTSIINKYYLGTNEAVKWVIKDKELAINFISPTKDVIGSVVCNNFNLEDSNLAVYDTKKLSNLISICQGDLILEVEKNNLVATQLKVSDPSFNLTYNLSDMLLIPKVGSVNEPDSWDIEVEFESSDLVNLVKAKNALSEINGMEIISKMNLDSELVCDVVFGDGYTHSNKITYQMEGKISQNGIKVPFNSDVFRTILNANKDMESGFMRLNSQGLLHLKFHTESTTSEYFMIRRAESDF